jgi:hypothetical protein
MTIFVAVICTLIALFVLICGAFGVTNLFGRLWLAVRAKIAAPLLAERAERQAEQERIMRDCTASTVQALIAGQRDTVTGVAREGFSAMLEVNRELLSEIRVARLAQATPRQAVMIRPPHPEPVPQLGHHESQRQALVPRRSLAKRLLFWKY